MIGVETSAARAELATTPIGHATSWLARLREAGIALVIVALFATFTAVEPRFAGFDNVRSIALQTAIFATLAVGQTLVVLTRNIDLSVGAITGFTAMVGGLQLQHHPGFPALGFLIVCVAVGTACGVLNGLLVALGRVPAIVATLGTMAIVRGAAFVVGGNRQVTGSAIPPRIGDLALRSPFGLPWLEVIALLLFALSWLFLSQTRSGRYVYAVGSNPEGAHARGVPVARTVLAAFVISGAIAGLAGAMYVARFGSVDPASAGVGYELYAVSAVVVGGTGILGGTGGVGHTLLGVLLIGIVNNGLTITGLSDAWQAVVQGVLILFAVAADALIRARYARHRQMARRPFA